MNTIRFCFTATVVFLVVTIGGRIASCEDNIVPIWKCCPLDRLYIPELRSCRPPWMHIEEYRQQLVNRLEDGFGMASDGTLNVTYHLPPYCNTTEVLVDVPSEEMHGLMDSHSSPYEFPPGYCFDLTPADELVARTCRPRDQYCSGAASCEEYNVPFIKCCPLGQLYDPEVRFCRPAGTDLEEYLQRRLDRVVANTTKYKVFSDLKPKCSETDVLVDMSAVEVRELLEAHPSPIEFPPGCCFDLTPSNELVAQTCWPRDQVCGRPGYTCVKKCCDEGKMYVDYLNDKWICENIPDTRYQIPFTLSVYETDSGGSPVGPSNNTVLPIYEKPSCTLLSINTNMFMTTDGKLHLNHEFGEWIIPETEYCVEYYSKNRTPEAADLWAHVCTTVKPPPFGFANWVILSTSVVCLVLTLIVYAILPYLRNAHGYYVMCYMACQLVYFVCAAIDFTQKSDLDSLLCIPFGYFSLFATLTTCFWLNVICFDIYWMLRYNNSINRNTSKPVRTIMYHIYCWGFSSIFVSTGYLFQNSQNEALRELAPDIGKYKCGVFTNYSYGTLIFLYLPTCGTLTANLFLFILTAIHCSRIKSELNKFQRTDSKIQIFLVYKERFIMSIKLFLVFGIPFLFLALCSLFLIVGIISEIIIRIHFLQGVFIFIIFVVKPKVLIEIRKKFRRSTVQSELIQLNNTTGTS